MAHAMLLHRASAVATGFGLEPRNRALAHPGTTFSKGAPGVIRRQLQTGCATPDGAASTEPARAPTRSESPAPKSLPYSVSDDDEGFNECAASYVIVSNEAHPTWTQLNIDVPDSPGLLRTITWVLNGMGMRVQNAALLTSDGTAQDVFWLTTWSGKKLTDKQAALLAERVEDFVVACAPRPQIQTEWACKNLRVSNTAHPQWTLMVIEGEPQRQGFLLELASVLSGTGVLVKEAYIQSGAVTPPPTPAKGTKPGASGEVTWPVDVAPPGYTFDSGRYFKFLLADQQGAKLDPVSVSALLFTYDVFTDAKHMPLVAPNMDAYLRQSGKS